MTHELVGTKNVVHTVLLTVKSTLDMVAVVAEEVAAAMVVASAVVAMAAATCFFVLSLILMIWSGGASI